jgi:hypothetical protein
VGTCITGGQECRIQRYRSTALIFFSVLSASRSTFSGAISKQNISISEPIDIIKMPGENIKVDLLRIIKNEEM